MLDLIWNMLKSFGTNYGNYGSKRNSSNMRYEDYTGGIDLYFHIMKIATGSWTSILLHNDVKPLLQVLSSICYMVSASSYCPYI